METVCKTTLEAEDWSSLISIDNLYLAYAKAQKGKQKRKEVAQFALRLESHLWQLQQELQTGTYIPGAYRQFQIYERKPRTISVAPFRDRVVHHALMNLLEPVFEHHMIPHSYACRFEKGVHKAVDQYQRWAKRYTYVLKLDVSRYFPSIDHTLLKAKLAPLINEANIQRLAHQILEGSPETELTRRHEFFPNDDLFSSSLRRKGLPIGNLTSQWFANWYLHDLDQWLTQSCGMNNAYLRYVDDLFLFHDLKSQLWQLAQDIDDRLQHQERLRLHPLKNSCQAMHRKSGCLRVSNQSSSSLVT